MEELKYDRDSVTDKIRENIKFLESNFGKIDVPMGRVFRLMRGKTDLPLSGGPGTLRAIYYKKSGKKYKAIAGDCYIQAVEWSPEKKLMLGVFINMEVQQIIKNLFIMMTRQRCFQSIK